MRYAAPLLLALLAACAGTPDAADVPADVRQRVAVFIEDGNCSGLQAEFDRADDSEVMRYIDEQLDQAGCY